MNEAEPLSRRGIKPAPVLPALFEQIERSDDVGHNEIGGAVYRAIDVAFGSKMHDGAGLVPGEQRGDERPVANVASDEPMPFVCDH